MDMANITASIILNEEQLRTYYNTSGSSLCKIQFAAYKIGLRAGLTGQPDSAKDALVKEIMSEYAPMPTTAVYNYIHRSDDGSENLNAIQVYLLDTKRTADLHSFKADVAIPLEVEGLWVLVKDIEVVKLVSDENQESTDNTMHLADAAYADRIARMSFRSSPNKLRIV